MTKIKNYELDSTINDEDKVIGTDGLPGANFGRTKNYSIASLVAYIDTQLDPVDGSGTLNTIPIWTPDGDTLGDSIMTYDTGNTAITVNGKLVVTNTISLQGSLLDAQGQSGSAGQLLSSTVTGVDWIDAPVSGVQGSGTLNTLPMWTPDGVTLGDSIIRKDTTVTLPDLGIIVAGKLNVHGLQDGVSRFVVSNSANFSVDAIFEEGIIDASSSSGTLNQVLTSTGTQTSWNDVANLLPANNILGGGTLNTVAMFSPDGTTISDSILTQNVSGSKMLIAGSLQLSQYAGLTWGNTPANQLTIFNSLQGSQITQTGSGDLELKCDTDVLIRSNSGGIGGEALALFSVDGSIKLYYDDVLRFNTSAIGVDVSGDLSVTGNSTLGNSTVDITTVNSTLEILSVVKDSTNTVGTLGQVLVANAASELLWGDQSAYTYTSNQDGTSVDLILNDGTLSQEVTLVAGNSITLTDDGSNNVTIAATGGAANTTYVLDSTQGVGSLSIELAGSDGSLTDYSLLAGTGVSFDNSVAGTTSIGIAADNVTGTGTLNKLPLWTPGGQTLGDSVVFQDSNQGVIISRPGSGASIDELTVKGVDSNIVIESTTAGDSFLTFKPNATSNQLGIFGIVDPTPATPSAKFAWKKGAAEYMRLDTTTGRLGIGTTTPVSKLDVVGDYVSLNGTPFVQNDLGDSTIVFGDVTNTGTDVRLSSGTEFLVDLLGSTLRLGNTNVGTQIQVRGPLWVQNSLQDGTQSPGTAGQVLTSTATQTSWVDAVSLFGGAGTENRGVLWGPNGTLTNSLLLHGSGANSVGLGIVPQTVGDESIAFTRSTARADYSFALGYESVTDGEFSVTLGKGSYAAGTHSMATNYKSLALGQSSFAGGHTSATGGDGAVALGHNASAGNYGAATLVSTLPNGQTQFDIEGIVGSVAAGLYMRYGEGLDVPDPRFEILTFTDNGNNSATITIPSPGIRPIQGELVVFEQQTPFRGDHQGGVAMGNDAFSLGEGAVSIGHKSVAEVDKAVALGDSARSSGLSSVAIGKNATATAADTIALGGNSTKILMTALAASASYANDAAAAAGGVSIAELYRNGNAVQIRLT